MLGWAGKKLVSTFVFARGCESPKALILSSQENKISGICVRVFLFWICWNVQRMLLACSVRNKILLKIRPCNNTSDEIYFCSGVSLSFQHPPPSSGAFNLGHSICSWQRSRLIGIEMHKGDTKLAIHPK